MTNFLIRLLILLVLPVLGCQPAANRTGGLYSTDTLPLIGKSDTSENEKNNRLIAFVGEKIEVKLLPHEAGSMDAGFLAKYKVLLRVYGNYSKDTIEFKAYDHYDWPGFSRYKNALLFVSEYEGRYYHQKYQYFDVYKTKNGRWASSYKKDDYEHDYNKNTTIKPEIIEFAERVAYPVKIKQEDGTDYKFDYPEPYYKTTGDSAIAIYGNYLEDLFALKKNGVLTARGLFATTPEEEEAKIQEVELQTVRAALDKNELKFMAFWKSFAASVREPGLQQLRRTALDSLWVCDAPIAAHTFIEKCFKEIFDRELIKRLDDSTRIEYVWTEIGPSEILSSARKEIINVKKMYRLLQVMVTKNSTNNEPPTVRFDFIETKKGYRLYGIDHHWFKECCR